MTRLLGRTQRPRLLRAATLALGAALALGPSAAAAATPALTVNPDSGGPGVQVTVHGTGFCGATRCGPVTISMGGYQVARGLHPDAGGAFSARFVVPGGLQSGQLYVIAKQTHDDGNEAQAMSGFLYSPSKGEEAERKALEAESLQRLVDPSRPAAHQGVPLGAVVGQPQASTTGPTASGTDAGPLVPAGDADPRWWLYAGGAGVAATLAVLALIVRRRNRVDATA